MTWPSEPLSRSITELVSAPEGRRGVGLSRHPHCLIPAAGTKCQFGDTVRVGDQLYSPGHAQPTGRWMIALLCDHEAAQMRSIPRIMDAISALPAAVDPAIRRCPLDCLGLRETRYPKKRAGRA
jgi:hypothetical protein